MPRSTYHRLSPGLYSHESGALIVRTLEPGPRGGRRERWEIGHWEVNMGREVSTENLGPQFYRLAEAAAHLQLN